MLEYKIAGLEDIDLCMESRLEMLRVVNDLDDNYQYDEELINCSKDYFLNGDQTTVLVLDEGRVIGCASMSYMWIMPTFSHPTGKRAHLMNVYTNKDYRRMGIACKMVQMLIDDAWDKGATEVSLDATESGRPLYESMGFTDSSECMILVKASN